MKESSGFSNWEFHKFEINGRYILCDVNSAQFYSIDELSYNLLDYIKKYSKDELLDNLAGKFSEEDILDTLEELEDYREKGLIRIGRPDLPDMPDSETVTLAPLNKLTINVANDCNMRCKYCWNHYGTYAGKPGLMDENTAIKAVDFLFKRSEDSKNLEIDFYGGEPLLNFDILKSCTEYAFEKAETENKAIAFSIETNGTLLNDSIIEYLEERNFTICISIDGDIGYHDSVRVEKNGAGTWSRVTSAARKILNNKRSKIQIRATLSPSNMNLLDTIRYLEKMGFGNVWAEYALELNLKKNNRKKVFFNSTDRDRQRDELVRYAKAYLDKILSGSYNWFDLDIGDVYNNTPRIFPCSVAYGNLIAVDAYGDIYPCLMFTGNKEYLLGNIKESELRLDLFRSLRKNRIYSNKICNECWTKFLCGGNCAALSYWYYGDISVPDNNYCEKKRHKLEVVIWLICELQEKAPDFFDNFFKER